MPKIAVIRIRGPVGLREEIVSTFNILNLSVKNHCVILEDTPVIMGMIRKINTFITWGEINNETLKILQEKKKSVKKDRLVYALQPPRKGFGRKGIKIPFKKSGAYGDRKEKINDLIKRML